jgi:hypothetical protein
VKALLDCGATSIFASPWLIARLGLETEHAHITTYGLDSGVLAHARDSRKTRLAVKYFAPVDEPEARDSVDEPEVLIVPMTAYDLVLELPWFKTRNPEIDCEEGKLLSLRRQPTKPNNPGNLEARAGTDVQMWSATTFRDLCASDEVSGAFSPTLGECGGMLGATAESHYNDGERLFS